MVVGRRRGLLPDVDVVDHAVLLRLAEVVRGDGDENAVAQEVLLVVSRNGPTMMLPPQRKRRGLVANNKELANNIINIINIIIINVNAGSNYYFACGFRRRE